MDHDELIEELERQLQVAEKKVKDLYKAGKIPGPEDYADIDRIKGELKTARRTRTMGERRTEPKLTRQVAFMVSDQEFEDLSERARRKGLNLSEYIRQVLSRTKYGNRG